jgi:HEAT repeat protein
MASITLTGREIHGRNLPMVCMRCGAAATERKEHRFTFIPWYYRLLASVTRVLIYKVVTMEVPVCDRCRGHWWRPLWVFLIGFGAFALLMFGSCVATPLLGVAVGAGTNPDAAGGVMALLVPGFFLLVVLGFFGWIAAIIVSTFMVVYVSDLQPSHVSFAGVSEEFVRAVERQRRAPPAPRAPRPAGAPLDVVAVDEEDDPADVRPVGPAAEGVRAAPGCLPPPRPAPNRPLAPPPGRRPAAGTRTPPPKAKSPVLMILLIVGGVLGLGLVTVCGGVIYVGYQIAQAANAIKTGAEAYLTPPANVDESLTAVQSGDPIRLGMGLDWFTQARVDEKRQREVAAALEPLAVSGNQAVRGGAARAFARWADRDSAPALARLLKDPDQNVQNAATDALVRLKDERAAPVLVRRMADWFHGQEAAQALKDLGPAAEPEVVKALNDPDQHVRDNARSVLKAYGTKDGVLLDQAMADLKSNEAGRRHAAEEWLAQAAPDEKRRPAIARALEGQVKGATPTDAAVRALARWADKDSGPVLVRFLDDPNEAIRNAALDGLIRLKDARAAAPLVRRLTVPFGRGLGNAQALKDLGPAAEPDVVKELHHPDQPVRDAVRDVLKSYGTRDTVLLDQTLADLKGADAARKKIAAEWLVQTPADEKRRPEVARALDDVVKGNDGQAREPAVRALLAWGTKDNVPTLVAVLTDPGPDNVRTAAITALGTIPDERGAEALVKQLTNTRHANQAGKALEQMGPAVAVPALVKALENGDVRTRGAIWRALGSIGTKDDKDKLQEVADREKDAAVSRAAQDALKAVAARPAPVKKPPLEIETPDKDK